METKKAAYITNKMLEVSKIFQPEEILQTEEILE